MLYLFFGFVVGGWKLFWIILIGGLEGMVDNVVWGC